MRAFRLNVYYSIASGIAVVTMAAVMAFLYYSTEVSERTEAAGLRAEVLARTFANVVWPEFGEALKARGETDPAALRSRPVTPRLLRRLVEIGVGVPIVKVKIYNLDGVAVFSSVPAEIGENKGSHPGFRAALEGRIENHLTHRGQISATEGYIHNVDVVESYIPIRRAAGVPVEAVFEMYMDVTQDLDAVEKATYQVLSGLVLCFSVLYGVLILIVRRADRIIRGQYLDLMESEHRAAAASRAKSEFLSMMSHELRTPLNAIIGFSEVLRERLFGELNEKQAEYVDDIHGSGKHLLSLINDVLDLSKIEAGRMELEKAPFDVAPALENAVALVRERAQRGEVTLGLTVAPEVATVVGDERRFKQIMLNLLSNAIKFTPAGGHVDVRARVDGDALEVAVADTGVGIATEDQAKIFEEFSQVGRDYLRKSEGTGLGLALTRSFVELHGGSISLDSGIDQGATFTIRLPLGADHA